MYFMETMAVSAKAAETKSPAAGPRTDPVKLLDTRFEAFYATVHRYLLHRVFARELAEELTAETFYKAIGSAGRAPAEETQMQLWLLRIATNLANHHYRKTRLRRFLLLQWATSRTEACTVAPAQAADGTDPRSAEVRSILQAMPVKYQSVLVLRYFGRMSFEEIAAVLQCRETTVRTRLSRAIKRMRERLTQRTDQD
jgi:RNA polymerase sigma-70 factor, ECF subfamily